MLCRTLGLVGAVAVAAAAGSTSARAQNSANFNDEVARQLLTASRHVLSQGGGALERLESLVFRGRARTRLGDGPASVGPVELKIRVPDHYLRVDTAGNVTRYAGFAGRTLLSALRTASGIETPPRDMRDAVWKSQRTWLGRFLLGTTTYVLPDLAVHFRTPGGVTAPGSPYDAGVQVREGLRQRLVLEASGADGFAVRMFFAPSHLPHRIEYEAGTKKMRIVFGDRRLVSGLQLPHRVTTDSDGVVVDDMTFDEILVNSQVPTTDFERK